MNFKEVVKSKQFKIGVIAVGALIVIILVFAAGVFVGLEKARFSYSWGENYFRNFARRGRFISDRDYFNAHGSAGQIIKIDGNNITLKNRRGDEVLVVTDSQTAARSMHNAIQLSDLKVNDYVAVIGSPDNQGQIQAKLIRVLPDNMPQTMRQMMGVPQ